MHVPPLRPAPADGRLAPLPEGKLADMLLWCRRNDVRRSDLVLGAKAGRYTLAVLEQPGLLDVAGVDAGDRGAVAIVADRDGRGPAAWPRAAAFLRWPHDVILLDEVNTTCRYDRAIRLAEAGRRVMLIRTTEAAAERWEDARLAVARR